MSLARPETPAVDPANDAVLAPRAALKRGLTMRRDVEPQVEQLRALVARLEGTARAGGGRN